MKSIAQKVCSRKLFLSFLLGWLVGLSVISFFVFSVKNPHASWGEWWMLKSLMLTPLVAAVAGSFFYVSQIVFPSKNIRQKIGLLLLRIILSGVIFWMGIVLGLDGTLWN